MLHDPKTVSGSDFDQETAEKIAPQFIARLELANCMWTANPLRPHMEEGGSDELGHGQIIDSIKVDTAAAGQIFNLIAKDLMGMMIHKAN